MKFLFPLALLLCFVLALFNRQPVTKPDSRQYPRGYPKPERNTIDQLRSYPLPRYLPGNHLERLFNWLDPTYLGGSGQPGVNMATYLASAETVQEELVLHWNYGIVIPSIRWSVLYAECPPFVKLANAHPEIPLHVITNWLMIKPADIGLKYSQPLISTPDLNPAWYSTFDLNGSSHTQVKFNFPDTLLRTDGTVMKFYFTSLLKWLTRPINVINDNGEEPPGPYQLKVIKNDPVMIRMKDSMKISSWDDFMAIRKTQMRNVYTSTFMKTLPELKNTRLSFYTVEGGPVDRFDWHSLKKCQSPLNGIYYSTPDFYPRWPSNWKDWKGPWHGWSWIDSGRKKEIKDGDYLFSPFVSAGWSRDDKEDIRPGQWLGLLKCLSVIGAEHYYVCYFNLGAPFIDASHYVWQAAMPAYAQGITSRFEDVLRDGNVLFEDGTPKITWTTGDSHVLFTVRKHNKKEKYVICGTYQPFSNDSNEIPEKKIITASIGGKELQFEIRRQGSVYIYEKAAEGKELFYQLDGWHENAHPDYWSRDFVLEAELADNHLENKELFTQKTKEEESYRSFTTYLKMQTGKEYTYGYSERDSVPNKKYLWVRYRGEADLNIWLSSASGDSKKQTTQFPQSTAWKWIRLEFPKGKQNVNRIHFSAIKGDFELDKVAISDKVVAGNW